MAPHPPEERTCLRHDIAHGKSLPLYFAIEESRHLSRVQATQRVIECLSRSNLQGDIRVTVLFSKDELFTLDSLNENGALVLEELRARTFCNCECEEKK